MDKNEQVCDYNEGWDAGYKTGYKDGQLVYLDILEAIEKIENMLTKIKDNL